MQALQSFRDGRMPSPLAGHGLNKDGLRAAPKDQARSAAAAAAKFDDFFVFFGYVAVIEADCHAVALACGPSASKYEVRNCEGETLRRNW